MNVYYSICIAFDLLAFIHNKLYHLVLPVRFYRGINKRNLISQRMVYLSDISTFSFLVLGMKTWKTVAFS